MEGQQPPAAFLGIPQTRGYQQEMLEASLRRNIVIAMDTGSGKTHIAVLRLKIESEREPRKISWFLAPTVGLCEQQRSVIRAALPLPVGIISGALEPDQWTDPKIWRAVLSTHRIVVSTPQVLLDALRHAYVNLGRDIGLLIFDEAHHAGDKHPYNMIMREFYDECAERTSAIKSADVKPFILGLTASPVFGGNVEKAFGKIETNLNSIILAPSAHRPELLQHVHRPRFKHVLHEPADFANSTSHNLRALSAVLQGIDIENDPSVISMRAKLPKLLAAEGSASPNYRRTDQRLSRALHKKDTFAHEGLRTLERTARDLCADIGPWAADWYVFNVVSTALGRRTRAVPTTSPSTTPPTLHALFAERNHAERAYLAGILHRVSVRPPDYTAEAICAGCSDKTNKLIETLRAEKAEWDAEGEVYRGLVFMQRRDAVLALSELLTHHPSTKDIFSIGSLVGSSDSTKRNAFLDITRTFLTQAQSETLADFRVGAKNLVVSTAVAEEGIDIQACGNVVRWDIPQNMVSWAQSRGRARHRRSSVILMFEKGTAHLDLIKKWERLEAEMVQKYTDEQRQLRAIAAQQEGNDEGSQDGDDDEFRLASTGAAVTLQSAISHLAHFCNVLPSPIHEPEQPSYDIFPEDYPEGYHRDPKKHELLTNPGPYGCLLTLPRFLPFQIRSYRTDEMYETKKEARRRAAFMAYVAMYHAGLLNDSLLPLTSSFHRMRKAHFEARRADVERREGAAGTREVDPWASLGSDVSVAQRWWSNELRVEGLGSFRMFTQRQMPPLELQESPCVFSIVPGGASALTAEEMLSAQCYTRRVLSIFHGSRMDWDALDFAYLFLPMDPRVDSAWETRREWADSRRSSVSTPGSTARDRVLANAADFSARFSSSGDVHLVLEDGQDSSFYKFLGWQHDRLSEEREAEVLEHYEKRVGEALAMQYPVVMALPIRTAIDFLLPQSETPTIQKATYLLSQYTSVVLANKTDISLSLLLPLILRTVRPKLTAHSLLEVLSHNSPEIRNIPLDLIETAITTPSANALHNYERLEWLGDAILKFITTVQLIAEQPDWPEGFLARAKDCIVSNANLAKCALGKQLHRYIIREAPSAHEWMPEYMKKPITENVDINEEEKGNCGGTHPSMKVMADAVEALIGAAYQTGGFEGSITCATALDVGDSWKPLSAQIAAILSRVQPIPDSPTQLTHPEVMLGYVFKRKALLVEALMHPSSLSDLITVSYERIASLGGALLETIVSDILFSADKLGKTYSPGQMTALRVALVNSHFLAYICLKTHVSVKAHMPQWEASAKRISVATDSHKIYLWKCISHSSHQVLEEQADTYTRYLHVKDALEQAFTAGATYPWAVLIRLQAPRFFSTIIGSLIGAIYIDSEGDVDTVRHVLERLGVLKFLRRAIQDGVDVRNPVSRIGNWIARHPEQKVVYETVIEGGMIICNLVVDGEVINTVAVKHTGKTSQDEAKFKVAEGGIKELEHRFGSKCGGL